MIRYLKQYKFLLFLTVLFTAISSLSYVFIAILLQQVMDIVDMGDMDGFIRILLFSLAYFALMGVFMYLQSLFSKKFVCKIMKSVRSKTFMGIEKHTIEDYSKNNTADYLSAITNDVKMIEDNFLLPLLQVIQYTIIFIASLAVMIYFDIIVTVCVIIAISIMLIVPSLFGGLLSKRQDKYSDTTAVTCENSLYLKTDKVTKGLGDQADSAGVITLDTAKVTNGTFSTPIADFLSAIAPAALTVSGNAKLDGTSLTYTEAGEQAIIFYWNSTELYRKTVTVTAKDMLTVSGTYTYNGREQTVDYEVKDGSKTLTVGKDYTVSGNTKKNAGTHTVTITGQGNYTGEVSRDWRVAPAGLTITAEDKTAYVGAQQPELTYKVDGLLEAGKEMLSDVTLRVSAPEGVVPMNRAGTYDIVVASATYDTGKYELTTENGTLTVRARHSSGTTTGSTGGVSVDRPANGTVTVSPANPVKGSTVTITVTPDKGQTLKDLEVLDKSGNSLPLTDLGNGKFSSVMPVGKVTVKAEFGEAEAFVNPYNDVKPGDWYYSAVKYVTVNGLMNGTGKGFEPNLATSRAMIWTILARMSGADTASDGEWYAAAQQWTVANGVSGGTMPNGTITREQLAAMLYRYAVSKGMVKAPATADLSAFADAGSVSSYAVEAMQWAVSTGLMNGMDGKLAPQGSATRAQVATMLMRFAELG